MNFINKNNNKITIKRLCTRLTDIRVAYTVFIIVNSCLSGYIFKPWSHFDCYGLWNDKYPHTPKSNKVLFYLRILAIWQFMLSVLMGQSWFGKLRRWDHKVSLNEKGSKWFLCFILTDFYRSICELCSLILFFGFYLDSVATRPSQRVLLSWIVDLTADGVVGMVPLFGWLLPMLFTIIGIIIIPFIWEEFCKQQNFNMKFSLFQFDSLIDDDEAQAENE